MLVSPRSSVKGNDRGCISVGGPKGLLPADTGWRTLNQAWQTFEEHEVMKTNAFQELGSVEECSGYASDCIALVHYTEVR